MKEYILTLFGVCAVSGMIKVMCPEGGSKKYIEMLCALCVITAIAVPMVRGTTGADGIEELLEFDDLKQSDNYDEIYKSYVLNGNIEEAEKILSSELEKQLGAEQGTLGVLLDCEHGDGGIQIVKANVIIDCRAVTADPDLIKEYIKQRLDVECQIIYENINEK